MSLSIFLFNLVFLERKPKLTRPVDFVKSSLVIYVSILFYLI